MHRVFEITLIVDPDNERATAITCERVNDQLIGFGEVHISPAPSPRFMPFRIRHVVLGAMRQILARLEESR